MTLAIGAGLIKTQSRTERRKTFPNPIASITTFMFRTIFLSMAQELIARFRSEVKSCRQANRCIRISCAHDFVSKLLRKAGESRALIGQHRTVSLSAIIES